MDHGAGEAARPTTVESTELLMPGALHGHGGEAHIHTSTFGSQILHRDIFNGQFRAAAAAAAARRGRFDDNSGAYHVRTAAGLLVAVFHGEREPGPGVVYANVGEFWRQPAPGDEVLVAGLQLPDPEGVVVPVQDNYGHYQLLPLPGAGRGEVLVAGLQLPDLEGVVPVQDSYGHYQLLPRPGAGQGEVHQLPDGVGHGEALVNLLRDGVGVVYGNHARQFRPGAGRGEVMIANMLAAAAGAVYGPGNFAQGTTGRAERNVGALRGPSIDGMVGENLRRLLAFVGIGACSVAVNGLAAGPGSPSVAFHLFALRLGGLVLVILHVLRV